MSEGWISVHRKLLNWEWFTDVNVSHVFLYCLLRANHAHTKWRGQDIGRGQFVTSLDTMSKETGLTVRQIRTALDKLKVTGELTSVASSKNRLISITNYNNYQDNDKHNDKQVTSKRQADDKQVTTDNNVNNNNNENNENNTNVLSKEKNEIDVGELYDALARQQKSKRTTAPEIELPYTTLPDEWKDFCKLEMKWGKEQAHSAFSNFRDYWTSPARELKNKKKDWFMTFKTTSRSGITKPNANIVQVKNSGRVDGMAMMREHLYGK